MQPNAALSLMRTVVSNSRNERCSNREHQFLGFVAETSQPKPSQPVKNALLNFLERGVQMKKLLLGSVALVALGMGAPAIAADMGVRARPVIAPVATWTGCYVGGNAGNNWGRSEYNTTAASAVPFPA